MKNRKPNRLVSYNYSNIGYYFITIKTCNNYPFFGFSDRNQIISNKYGRIAKEHWEAIPNHHNNIKLDTFIIMPDHIHGIISIVGNSAVGNGFSRSGINRRQHQLIPKIINRFKGGVTRQLNKERPWPFPTDFQWQKSYYDHVIRNEKSMQKLREYILYNHLKY